MFAMTAEDRRKAISSPRSALLAPLALGTTLVLWASSFPFIRVALEAYSPGQIALMRFAVASALLGALVLVLRGNWRVGLPRATDVPALFGAGLLGIVAYPVVLGYGQLSVGSGAAAVLVDTAPIFTALFAALFLKERLSAAGWIGMLAAFAGVALISVGEAGGGVGFAPGAPLLLVAAVLLSAYFVAQKPLLASYSAVAVSAYAVFSGTLVLLVFLPGLPAAIVEASLAATLSILYLGVFPSAIAYTTWAYALSKLPASRTASFLYLVPPITFVIAWAFFGETPALLSLFGATVTLAAVLVVNSEGTRATPDALEDADEDEQSKRKYATGRGGSH